MQVFGQSELSSRSAAMVSIPAVVAVSAMLLSRSGLSSLVCWDVAWTAAATCALCALLASRHHTREKDRWTLWVAAAAFWLAGQLAWDMFGIMGMPQSPNVADVGWWAFAVLVIISMVRVRDRSLRLVVAAETLPLIASALALTFAELWHDASVSSLPLAPRLSALVYPALYVSAFVLTLQSMVGGSSRRVRSRGARLMLAGVAAQAVAFTLWSQQLLDQTYLPGRTLLDPLWVVGLLAIAAGATLAARTPAEAITVGEPSDRGGILPAAMFVVLLAALVQAGFAHAPAGAEIALAAGLTFSGASLIVRTKLLEHRLWVLLGRERAALANLAEREVELGRLNEQLVEDSRRDVLTGMRNRRAMADDLPILEAMHQERGDSIALALCDIDHFKPYNDRLGHLAGDQALRAIAASVRGALRGGDTAYRFGGEELLLVLGKANAREALTAAERVRAAVEEMALPHPHGIGGLLTISIGVAAGSGDVGRLLACADAALYEAKHFGRNRVEAASDTTVPQATRRPLPSASEEPIPRHLRGMLTVSRAAASGRGELPVLDALAHAIRSELSFRVVAVNLLNRGRTELRVVVVLGDEDARQTLLGSVNPWREWELLIDSDHVRCGAIWLPAGSYDFSDATKVWMAPGAAAQDPNSWQPEDMLLLPLRGAGGEVLGVVSVDQPLTGRRPDDPELTLLMTVADHAGLALEQAQRGTATAAAVREESQELRLAAMMLLAETLDLRDPGTALHSRTVGTYARETAAELGLPPARSERVHAAGVLHDLGKLGITDAILYKPGPLDEAEWHEIRRHPELGARILEHAGMTDIAGWVRAHHERLDGRGYPHGLPAGEIVLEARILAVADAYEAMVSDRPYHTGIQPARACEELMGCAGTQFDPLVVDAFLRTLDRRSESAVERLVVAA